MEKLKLNDTAVVVWTVEPERTLTDRQVDIRIRKIIALEERIAELKALEKEVKALKDEIAEGIGAKDRTLTIETKNFVITRKVEIRHDIDGKRLKAELPEVALEYTKETTVRKFAYKERG